jgi:hypothetical protein
MVPSQASYTTYHRILPNSNTHKEKKYKKNLLQHIPLLNNTTIPQLLNEYYNTYDTKLTNTKIRLFQQLDYKMSYTIPTTNTLNNLTKKYTLKSQLTAVDKKAYDNTNNEKPAFNENAAENERYILYKKQL